MKIRVDFYKPSGKWYSGGLVDIGDSKPWHGRDILLDKILENQKILVPGNMEQWTIVSDDPPGSEIDPNYKDFFKAVLQIGVY